jgi:hypothetical protein
MLGKLFQLLTVAMLLSTAAGGAWLVGGGPLRGHADAPVTVDAETATELGFAEPTVEPVQVNDTVATNGVGKRIDVSGYVTATGTQDGSATVMLLTLPGWEVAGLSLNPLTYLPLKQAVTYVLPNLPIETPEVRATGEAELELGNRTVTAGEYAAEDQGMRVVVARRTMDGDAVFAVAAYPTDDPDARDRIEELFAAVTHR